jgi:hypothetical protein
MLVGLLIAVPLTAVQERLSAHQTLAHCREKAASVDLALEADDDATASRTMKMSPSASALLEHSPGSKLWCG